MRIDDIKPGEILPVREFKPDNVQLFLYNAALWNAHRIHFDYPYATEVEGYPGLVIAGPLMGDWLTQVILDWAGEEGLLASFSYTNRKYACIGEVLHSDGRVVSVDIKTGEVEVGISILNQAGDILTPGTAVVRFNVD